MEESQVTKLVLIGGSAGSLEVLMQLLPELAFGLDFPIVIVLHRKNSDDTTLEELIAMKTVLPVREIEDKTVMQKGSVYIVPSDYHLLFENDASLSLDTSEKVNYSRPSIDVVFESAAVVFRESAVAILLSGSNADGASGCRLIKENNGKVILQNPKTADMGFMPNSALQLVTPDFILESSEIASVINEL
ncbi:chemotaxis protein CheB [Flavobacterium sp.]|uniref:chemotaxis protein CheB n=1 Tax=Flavobacterium sp. TaxID=239 RepID=UPI001207C828|nr:chemotaxis protein CheB [Flavobacterium sp.]RZJ70690.1 MAG: chemotaxis protein CheB [Flavobacterium sp.]